MITLRSLAQVSRLTLLSSSSPRKLSSLRGASSFQILPLSFCKDFQKRGYARTKGEYKKVNDKSSEKKGNKEKTLTSDEEAHFEDAIRKGDIERAYQHLKAFEKLKDETERTRCFNALLKSTTSHYNVHEAAKIFEQLKSEQFKPNEDTFITLINGYGVLEYMEEAENIFSQMTKFGISASVHVCNAMINGYCFIKDVKNAEEKFSLMIAFKIAPNIQTFNSLMTLSFDIGDLDRLEYYFDIMKTLGVSRTPYIVKLLLRTYIEKGLIHKAQDLYSNIRRMKDVDYDDEMHRIMRALNHKLRSHPTSFRSDRI